MDELNHHQCIAFELPSNGKVTPWFFKDIDIDQEIQWIPTNRILVKEDILGVVSLAENGLGICQSYEFIVNEKFNKENYNLYLKHTQVIPVPFLYCMRNINICLLPQELLLIFMFNSL